MFCVRVVNSKDAGTRAADKSCRLPSLYLNVYTLCKYSTECSNCQKQKFNPGLKYTVLQWITVGYLILSRKSRTSIYRASSGHHFTNSKSLSNQICWRLTIRYEYNSTDKPQLRQFKHWIYITIFITILINTITFKSHKNSTDYCEYSAAEDYYNWNMTPLSWTLQPENKTQKRLYSQRISKNMYTQAQREIEWRKHLVNSPPSYSRMVKLTVKFAWAAVMLGLGLGLGTHVRLVAADTLRLKCNSDVWQYGISICICAMRWI